MEFEKFANPPIKESIFILKFQEEISLDLIERFTDSEEFKDKYPYKKNSAIIKHDITLDKKGKDHKTSFKNLQTGFIIQDNENPQYVIQIKKDSISFHKIKNYKDWHQLIGEFQFVVNQLSRFCDSLKIKEVGIRYINHIPVATDEYLSNYFNLLPSEVEGIPKKLDGLFLQLAFTEKEMNGIIIESLSVIEEKLNFIIDLRVSKKLNITLDNKLFWNIFSEIREFKNKLFFSLITDQAKEKFR